MENITKGVIMKKFILLIALSVLFYSAPGNAVQGRIYSEPDPAPAAKLAAPVQDAEKQTDKETAASLKELAERVEWEERRAGEEARKATKARDAAERAADAAERAAA